MNRILLTLLIVLTSLASEAQWRRTPLEPAEEYVLEVGNCTMVVDAANGARITSLRYDTLEVLSQNRMPNMYGSTFWTSPQKEWNWPPVREHDIMRYSVVKSSTAGGECVTMTSQLSEKIPLRIVKSFSTDKKEGCFVVSYTIINEGSEERKVAPWEITRVPPQGTVSFDCALEGIWPSGLMNFVERDGMACYDIDEAEKQRKINADGKGWLSYENNGIVLTKVFPDLTAEQPAPGEAEIQVYVHQGRVYVEIEEQGAYTLLQPGESLNWTVRWFLKKKQ